MTLAELIAYYVNLLPIQYFQPNAQATVSALVGELLMNNVVQQAQAAFELETAVGAQLDILADYVGATRYVTAPGTDQPCFSMPDCTDTDALTVPGFIDANFSLDATWFFLDSAHYTTTTLLNDAQLRLLVQYLIRVNTMEYTMGAIDALIEEFFAPYVSLTDGQDMTMTWVHDTDDPGILFSIVAQLDQLPRPAGVGQTVFDAPVIEGFFGMQDSDAPLDLDFEGFGDSFVSLDPDGYFIAAP